MRSKEPGQDKNERGQQGEKIALEYLKAHNMKLVAQNYRCYYGEVDLIMRDGAVLVFVEVRARSGLSAYGSAVESITVYKLRRVVRASCHYLTRSRQHHCDRRIDVVGIDIGIDQIDRIEWIKNAFEVK